MKNMIAEPTAYAQGLKKDSIHAKFGGHDQDQDSREANASESHHQTRPRANTAGAGNPTAGGGFYHSDEEKSQKSNNSSTLAHYTR